METNYNNVEHYKACIRVSLREYAQKLLLEDLNQHRYRQWEYEVDQLFKVNNSTSSNDLIINITKAFRHEIEESKEILAEEFKEANFNAEALPEAKSLLTNPLQSSVDPNPCTILVVENTLFLDQHKWDEIEDKSRALNLFHSRSKMDDLVQRLEERGINVGQIWVLLIHGSRYAFQKPETFQKFLKKNIKICFVGRIFLEHRTLYRSFTGRETMFFDDMLKRCRRTRELAKNLKELKKQKVLLQLRNNSLEMAALRANLKIPEAIR